MRSSTIISFVISFLVAVAGGQTVHTNEYNSDVYNYLYEMAEFCEVAYCISEFDRPAFEVGVFQCAIPFCSEHPNIEVLKIFVADPDASGTGYIVADNKYRRIIVVFRGSSTIFDWLEDFDFIPTEYVPLTSDAQSNYTCSECYAHEGFYNTLKTFAGQVFPFVKELKEGKYADYQVVTTGHSLGGALTNLAGIEFQLMGYNPLVVSLAGPKVGNLAMANYMDEIFNTPRVIDDILAGHDLSTGFIRVVHEGDIVPYIPPTEFFWHGGAEFYIDKFLLPHPQSVTYLLGSYVYVDVAVSEINAFIKDQNFEFIYDHISYFISTATCEIANVFNLFTGLQIGGA